MNPILPTVRTSVMLVAALIVMATCVYDDTFSLEIQNSKFAGPKGGYKQWRLISIFQSNAGGPYSVLSADSCSLNNILLLSNDSLQTSSQIQTEKKSRFALDDWRNAVNRFVI